MIKGLIVGVILLVMIVTGIEGAEGTPGDTPYYGVDIGSYSNKSRLIRYRIKHTNFVGTINSFAANHGVQLNTNHTRTEEYINFIATDHGLNLSIVPDTLSREGVRIKITSDNDSVYTVSLDVFFNLYVRDSDYNWLLVSPAICGSYATKVDGVWSRWFDGIFAPIPEACLDRDTFGRRGVVFHDGFRPADFHGEDFFFEGEYIIRHILFECFGYLPDGQYKISIPVNMDFRGYQRFQISTTASVEFSLP